MYTCMHVCIYIYINLSGDVSETYFDIALSSQRYCTYAGDEIAIIATAPDLVLLKLHKIVKAMMFQA